MADGQCLAHLDLDTLAWLPTNPPERAPLETSEKSIEAFIGEHQSWVIEGCYTDLLEVASAAAEQIIFMNLDVEQCIENAKNRPWESHKYESKQAQDANLEMLIGWIEQYTVREDEFSHAAHLRFYENFSGKKVMRRGNEN